MSKSLGNFFTVRDLLAKGVPGEVIRMVFLGTHYGKPMDWTREKAVGAASKLDDFVNLIWRFADLSVARELEPDGAIVSALADDLNTHSALVALEALANTAKYNDLARNLDFLGILSFAQLEQKLAERNYGKEMLVPYAEKLAALREAAMVSKDFAPVDAMKAELVARNVEVRMSKSGVELLPGPGFDPVLLEGLL